MNQATIPDYSISSNSIKIGSIWEHYKGLQYKILAIARHHENLEELVVYQALYGNGDVWVRPLHSFRTGRN